MCDDDDLLVIDKPAGIVVHGGDERWETDLVRRLARYLRASGRDSQLFVHQRLDQAVSGVLLFGRNPNLNRALAEAFAGHGLERRYVAVVEGRLPQAGRFEGRLAPVKGERTRVVARGGQHALTEYRVLERVGRRALVELRPLTGRKHQLRAQLAQAGAPIVGDGLYGGPAAARLYLHATSLELLGRKFSAALPASFGVALRGELREPCADPRQLVADGFYLRAPLSADYDCYRILNDAADEAPGLSVDRYGDYAVVNVESLPEATVAALADALLELGFRGVYLKRRARADLRREDHAELAAQQAYRGANAPEIVVVHEGERRHRVALADGLSVGLFLDQRDNRTQLASLSRDARVLNLFCYTGSFSVAAALGGAAHVTSVDLSRRVLEEAMANFVLNGLSPTAHAFVKEDALLWLERASRKPLRYELIVLDPPSFGSRARGAFSVEQHLAGLLEHCLKLLAPGGRLLSVTNHRKTSLGQLRALLRSAAERAQVPLEQVKDAPAQLDFPDVMGQRFPSKSVWVTRS